MKVQDLSGDKLDYWVAMVLGWELVEKNDTGWYVRGDDIELFKCFWMPSTDWSQCGPLIRKYRIALDPYTGTNNWAALANCSEYYMDGETPLIAAMRALVASKYGDEVDD